MIAFAIVAMPLSIFAIKNCECGTHATGITTYTVSGSDCCSSATQGSGIEYTYTQQDNGVWEVSTTKIIEASVAQSNCCDQSV